MVPTGHMPGTDWAAWTSISQPPGMLRWGWIWASSSSVSLWTDPVHLGRWFRPSVDEFGATLASVDLREGGAVRFEMIRPTGEVHAVSGRIVGLEPPHRLSYTWRWDGEENESVVELAFTETGDGTSVAITHTRLIDQADAERHAAGWDGMLTTLGCEPAASGPGM
jgi:uncharacterized protein YndB with AHSA1/START domain